MALMTDSEFILKIANSHAAACLLWHWCLLLSHILLQMSIIILYYVDIKYLDPQNQQ